MKQRYIFRILSILLALTLVFELFPTGALALENGGNEESTVQEVAEGERSIGTNGKSTSVWPMEALSQ